MTRQEKILAAPPIPVRDILTRMVQFPVTHPNGIPVADLADIRHMLTASIRHNLYGIGDRNEGRDALRARTSLDQWFFKGKENLAEGSSGDGLVPLYRAIILETFCALVELLDNARKAGGGTRRGIKAQMLELIADPDRIGRFNDADQAKIREIADGLAVFAKVRFDRLHVAIRVRAGQFMPPEGQRK
jgi:hypothetical protein